MYYTIRSTPFGPFALVGGERGIFRADFQDGERPVVIDSAWIHKEAPLLAALEALERYCAGERENFDLRYDLRGTPFQLQVWRTLLTIAQGTTLSYLQLAAQIGRENGFRAVGAAVGRNPVSLFIPCHRVVGTNGSLTGYAGGLPLKEALLRHEGALRG
ncbi:MAG: methylated-DNA--[protein]-cysteine S-methyltransferase [Pseudomonadales bacterium]|jgi:methylated-DNA-[protein]-cysteine S-methyltransferase|nr:methylated-DNA--[protein]-cysteine S-methyltransferase [Pseudomonadales bacterium]